MPENQSVTTWFQQLRAGDDEAARRLWQHYFDRLVQLAREHLGSLPRRVTDEEDVALSVFYSLCTGAERGQFNQLADRDELWRLLVTMTIHKVVDKGRHSRRQKRGGGNVRGESAVGEQTDDSGSGFDGMPGEEPTPEILAMLAEEHDRLMRRLDDDTLRRIACWKLEGYTNAEIAQRLDITHRSVERKLQQIRLIWSQGPGDNEYSPDSAM